MSTIDLVETTTENLCVLLVVYFLVLPLRRTNHHHVREPGIFLFFSAHLATETTATGTPEKASPWAYHNLVLVGLFKVHIF